MTIEELNIRLRGRATAGWYTQPGKRGALLGVVFPGTDRIYLYRSYRYLWELAEKLEEQLRLQLLDRCRHGCIIREPVSWCEECRQQDENEADKW